MGFQRRLGNTFDSAGETSAVKNRQLLCDIDPAKCIPRCISVFEDNCGSGNPAKFDIYKKSAYHSKEECDGYCVPMIVFIRGISCPRTRASNR